jgi:uncharacterized protein (DUF169 family)
MTAAQSDELMGLIGQMGSLEYMAGQEVPNIPTVPAERTGANGGIIEGPLADLPDGEVADVVLLWVNGEQAMLLNEAFGGASWGAQTTPVFGRPACAAIPGAMRSGRPSLSLGCAGMRTFTEISKEKMLAVIPASALATVADNLRVTAAANESMDSFYADRRSAFNGS